MTEHQHSASADGADPGDPEAASPTPLHRSGVAATPRINPSSAPWGDGLRMIAVTSERLAMANCSAGPAGYLPTVPPDSEDRFLG